MAYIDREKFAEAICNFPAIDEDAANAVISLLHRQTTADVVEVKHGYWKQNSYAKRIYYCSVCNRHIEDASESPYQNFPYCHCGAKMDGEKE